MHAVDKSEIRGDGAARPLNALLVEDSADEAELVIRELRRAGFDVHWERVDCEATLLEALRQQTWEVVISDFAMPRFDGLTAFRLVQAHDRDLPFIFLSGVLGEERAVEAMRNGARDYVLKGNLRRLTAAVSRELEEAAERRQRRQAERALEIEERRYRSIFESAAVALAELDFSAIRTWLATLAARGVEDVAEYLAARPEESRAVADKLRVLDGNQAMMTLLEADSREELLGSLGKLLAPVSDARWNALLQAVLDRRPQIQTELEVQTFTGRAVPVMLSMRIPTAEADFQNIIVSMLDVSEQRHLAERAREAQRLETVGRLAGGVAHDFNNLLAVIGSFASIVHDDLTGHESAQKDLEVILDATRRAAALTSQLLAFSRRQIQELQIVDINRVVDELDKILRRLIGEDIELSVKTAADLGAVKADPSQIEQVLMNLAVNARDAMPRGGTLTIATRNVSLARAQGTGAELIAPGHYVVISVSDTGVGMDDATRRRVFEPFFTTKGPGKGTGMGLSTVYGIVKQSGGHVEVVSQSGAGARFDVYLPRLEKGSDKETHLRGALRPAGGTETVLLVEDDDLVRKAARRILETDGYQVLEAANGAEALALAAPFPGPIDLLLTDVVMPRMNGRDLATALRAARPAIKIIYVSGYAAGVIDTDDPQERRTHLRKPFSPAVLLGKIREELDAGGGGGGTQEERSNGGFSGGGTDHSPPPQTRRSPY
jgi:two-component system cell cycle sensor histidine kinase/response regulator CckA